MYRSGERIQHHRKLYAWLIGFVCFLVIGVFASAHFLRSDTYIAKAPPATTNSVTYVPTNTTTFTEPLFTISLPSDWKLGSSNATLKPNYHFQSTLVHQDARWLDIYVDASVPRTLGVNHVLAVRAADNQLTLGSNVSDNCANFTGPVAGQPATATSGKWQGIDFLCDLGNYARDVVGTSSSEGPNVVTLTGASGPHQFFFAYTDNNASADYSIFTNALKTFRMK